MLKNARTDRQANGGQAAPHAASVLSAQSLPDTFRKHLVGGDCYFGISDRLETSFDIEIKRKRSVLCRMRGIRLELKTPPSRLVRASALENCPGLSEFTRHLKNAIDLVASGKSATVEEYLPSGHLLQKKARCLKHDFHYEVVLLHRVFDVFQREQGSANRIFTDERAVRALD